MKEALKDTSSTPFRIPSSVKFVKIDRVTGKFPTPLTPKQNVFFEAFKAEDSLENIGSNSEAETNSEESQEEESSNNNPSGIY